MLTFKPKAAKQMDPLERDDGVIARRRMAAAKRAERIKDVNGRKKVIDTEEINEQIASKKYRQQQEQNEMLEYGKTLESYVEQLGNLEQQREQNRLQKNVENANFLKTQKREKTETWLINNPGRVREERPPRIDDSEEIAKCSFQKFDGEDLGYNERKKQQQRQVRKWCNEAISKKDAERSASNDGEAKYHSKVTALINESLEKDQMKRQLERQRKMQNAQTNIVIAAEKAKKLEDERKALDNDLTEQVKRTIDSDFLMERRHLSIRQDHPHRYIPYAFKGFDEKTHQQYLESQKQQMIENAKRKEVERLVKLDRCGIEDQLEGLNKLSLQKAQMDRQTRIDISKENLALAELKKKEKLQAKANDPKPEHLSLFF